MLKEKGIFAPTFCPWNVADEKTWYARILNCHHLRLHGHCHDLQCLLMILTENSFQGLRNAFNAVDFTIMIVLWMESCFHFLRMVNFIGDNPTVLLHKNMKLFLLFYFRREWFVFKQFVQKICFRHFNSNPIESNSNQKFNSPWYLTVSCLKEMWYPYINSYGLVAANCREYFSSGSFIFVVMES